MLIIEISSFRVAPMYMTMLVGLCRCVDHTRKADIRIINVVLDILPSLMYPQITFSDVLPYRIALIFCSEGREPRAICDVAARNSCI